jgi:hypothetical protein
VSRSDLGDDQHFRLRDLLRYNLKIVRAYLLKEAFQQLWEYNSPAWAGKFLDEWCRLTMRSRIEPMKKIARSLRKHRELILNYFRAQKLLSSGVVEGLNNKAKVTMRKSYGFRTYRVSNSPSITHLASCPSRSPPTISSDQPSLSIRTPANIRLCASAPTPVRRLCYSGSSLWPNDDAAFMKTASRTFSISSAACEKSCCPSSDPWSGYRQTPVICQKGKIVLGRNPAKNPRS